ncbi:proline dehydrogenase [Nocardia speluncae]|uniref:proline dehydrogenase n=1 Tax=Nocardia speluncae TaxID=419477 RepID=A0A846XHL4_9NOCA|nr:proline dehydrogenase family protein [Nocardia speluncae]NKY34156.1 proline dehydrogenase [Nocardia speluncae]
MNPLRPAILAAAGSERVKRTLTTSPVTAPLVRRFVPGETRSELVAAARELLASGRAVSVDFLGEYTTDRAQADAAVAEYLALINDLAALDTAAVPAGAAPLEVSVKLSALGQWLGPDGPAIATENLRVLCTKAAEAGVWVTVDAEDHTTTASTLAAIRRVRPDFAWLGTVIQAYLYRSVDDCRDLAAAGARVRLCKGAYQEPDTVAHQHRADVDSAYLRCLDVLMQSSARPLVASHDPALIAAATDLAARAGRGPGELEYQMLYGIRTDEQTRLAGRGEFVRVYVPYGNQWYGYLMRRLAERPANLGFFLRALTTPARA